MKYRDWTALSSAFSYQRYTDSLFAWGILEKLAVTWSSPARSYLALKSYNRNTSPQAENSQRCSKSIFPLPLLILITVFFSPFLGSMFPHLPSCICTGQNSRSSSWVAALHRRFTDTCMWDNPQRDLPKGTESLEFLLPSPPLLLRGGAASLKPLTACFLFAFLKQNTCFFKKEAKRFITGPFRLSLHQFHKCN